MKKVSAAFLLLMALICQIGSAQEAKQSPHGKLTWDCLDCHNTESWTSIKPPLKFQHEETGFALMGQHAKAACGVCHRDLRFSYVGTACADCHTDVHRGQLGNSCQNCHSPQNWQSRQDNFALHASRGFPLVGVHSITDCGACHIGQERNEFADISPECQYCHKSNFEESTNPNHTLAGFSADCQQCHQPVAASWNVTSFRHTDAFALRGQHASTGCADCHASEYRDTSPECYGCHEQDYAATTNPSHTSFGFPTNCEACHNDMGWETSQFDHIQASGGFALNGAHSFIQCTDCHINNQLEGLSRECYGCHQSDFTNASDPGHVQNNFPQTCLTCHNENAWAPAAFDHSLSQFPLTGAHISVSCNSCHASGYTNTPTECYSCHASNYDSASEPNHVDNFFPHDCTQCHSTLAWEPATFNHANTQFPLTGAHVSVACNLCHASGYQNTPIECYACHQSDYESAADPNHVQNSFNHDCTQCHSTSAWEPANFNHANTQFPLTGAHTTVSCISCHSAGYQNTPIECYACHQSDYESVSDPDHVQNNFNHDCTQCHNTSSWDETTFNHNNTQFPLTGAHTSLQCIACHAGGYNNTPTNCYACHQSDYESVSDPNHVQNNFNHDCTQCHSTAAWEPSTFNHANTQFPLTGAHVQLQCIDCHANGYNIPSDCWSCHEADYHNAEGHDSNNFPHDCTQCHSTSSWDDERFNHSNTQFPLTGAHISLQCISCHASGYQGIPIECYACHQTDYVGVDDPNHVADNFSQVCTQCHTTAAWLPATYDHNLSQFPLTGAHVGLQCVSCHSNGFDNTAGDCYSCHQSDFNGVPDPSHVQNNFSHFCTECHTTLAWLPATFNHFNTQFPLTGAHASLQCIACHASGYDNTPTECYACHQSDFDGVADPNHVQNNFSHVCTECHTTTAWLPVTFNHSNTQFPLTGAHASLQCIACHANGYNNTPTECYACHQSDFDGVLDPNHAQNNFSHVCTECHTTTAWLPVTFNHSNTQFPLTGAHVSLQCIACHAGGYDNTPTECYACHQSDYNNAEPNHQAAGFPTTCQNCHNTGAWTPTTWDHDAQYFPIYSGRHRDEWNVCADCHVNSSDFTVFECIFCHEHNQPDTDNDHDEVPGYQYNSQACYSCHPRGEGDG